MSNDTNDDGPRSYNETEYVIIQITGLIIICLLGSIITYSIICCCCQCMTAGFCHRNFITKINFYRMKSRIEKGLSPIDYNDVIGDICTICLEDYEGDDNIMKIKKCTHNYHFKCISKWLIIKNTCPLCVVVSV